MPNKQNIAKWVAALRSGEYDQVTGALHKTPADRPVDSPTGYCCLGVACEISELGEWTEYGSYRTPGKVVLTGTVLPDDVVAWLGVDMVDPVIGYNENGHAIQATEANDSYEWSFDKIADAIEQTYLLVEEAVEE